MSIGFAPEDSPTIWRGPMAIALCQPLRDVLGGLDVLVVDMLPGTGDAQPPCPAVPAGAVIVSTPQTLLRMPVRV